MKRVGVQELKERLDSDDVLLDKVKQGHENYAKERWSLLSESDKELVAAQGWEKRLRYDGVSGMREGAFVKCLHTHYAHFLARGDESLIGSWVQEILDGNTVRR